MSVRMGWVGGGRKRDVYPIRKDLALFAQTPFYLNSFWYAGDLPTAGDGSPQQTGPGTTFPFSLSARQVLEWFSIVRQWKIKIAADYGYGSDDGHGGLVWKNDGKLSMSFNYRLPANTLNLNTGEQDEGRDRVKEPDCVMDPGFASSSLVNGEPAATESTDTIIEDVDYDFDENVDIQTMFFLHSMFGLFRESYFPQCIFNLQIGSDFCSSVKFFNEDFPPDNIQIGHVNIKTPATAFNTPLYQAYIPAATPGSDQETKLLSASFDISAIQFWPFGNSDRANVYDPTTGAELVNPFS